MARHCEVCGLSFWESLKRAFTLRTRCMANKAHRFRQVHHE